MHRAMSWGLALMSLVGCGSPAPKARAVAPSASTAAEPPMYRALPNLPLESIAGDAYGMYLSAADAPGIGDVVAPFSLPVATGGTYTLAEKPARDLVIVFYRGFW